MVFPNISKLNALNWNEQKQEFRSSWLNNSQVKAIKHIITKKDYSPPLIVYGPFGTGKTETLAEATKYLLQHRPQSRILICAYNNSAADIYLTKYLGDFLQEKGKQTTTIRIYTPERRYTTVPLACHPYMLYSKETSLFDIPNKELIESKRIIVTTIETAIFLTCLGIKGMFTHIFIDEAAQALECQVWIPLSLADTKTCIVLTGDHRQMNPKVYDTEARNQKFDYSILRRLHQYYTDYCEKGNGTFNNVAIFLNQNYRSNGQLLKFLAETFYGGEDNLICCSNIPTVDFQPFYFFGVFGKEVQTEDSTSCFNEVEADCVVKNVCYVYNNWPPEWGEKDAKEIQVVAAYPQQVTLIRKKLRAERLRNVSVETIYTIQGKQFRVLFISIVRTRDVCETPHMKKCLEEDTTDTIGEYGFLSEPNMLNTALTRAQSVVYVVGDPIAVCSIGECKDIWKKYIKRCHDLDTLSSSLTYEMIQEQVKHFESSYKGVKITRLSEKSLLAKDMMNPLDAGRGSRVTATGHWVSPSNEATHSSQRVPSTVKNVVQGINTPFRYGSQKHTSQVVENKDHDDWDDFQMKPDELIQRLGDNVLSGEVPIQSSATNAQKHKSLYYRYKGKEERGRVVFYRIGTDKDKRRLLTGRDTTSNVEDSSDDEILEEDDHEGNTNRLYRKEYNKPELNRLLQEEPDTYKRCIISIRSTFFSATLVDLTSDIKQIQFRSRSSLGRAFNNDEVVVQILHEQTVEDNPTNLDKPVELFGVVVGILNRAINPRYKVFVCRTDPINTSIMLPLNKTIPPISNLGFNEKNKGHKEGYVIVYNFNNYNPQFDRYEPIDPVDPSGKLFLVRYLKWERRNKLPLGIVIGIQPVGNNLESGMTIINKEHHIKLKLDDRCIEASKIFQNYVIPKPLYTTRKDLTQSLHCFTIDSQYTDDMDDALSVEMITDAIVRVGIHIADVTHFVKKDSIVDAAAYKRGTTYYPKGKPPIHMLPTTLMSACSLSPHNDKLALSIFLSVNKNGEVIHSEACKTIIRSKRKFTYNEVADILRTEASVGESFDVLNWSLQQLFNIAQLWRQKRIGKSYLHNDVDRQCKVSAQAHILVAEMMIMANHLVASCVFQVFPQRSPLLIHLAPDKYKEELWRKNNFTAASNMVSFNNVFTPNNETCCCQGTCTCIDRYVTANNMNYEDVVKVPLDVWLMLCDAAACNDWEGFKQLLVSPENYPESAVALAEYRKLQNRAFYVCSMNLEPTLLKHHGLNLDRYTHFSSPIRRYFDITVHRILSAYLDQGEISFSDSELIDIIRMCNNAAFNSKSYDKAVLSLHLSLAMERKPMICYPVIEAVDDGGIALVFPNIACLSESQRKLKMSYLAPAKKPEMDENGLFIKIQWQERIYNTRTKEATIYKQESTELTEPIISLSFCRQDWQAILTNICEDNLKDAKKCFSTLHNDSPSFQGNETLTEEKCKVIRYTDINNEKMERTKVHFFRHFHKYYKRNQQVRVQLAPVLHNGILTPKIQLYFLSREMAICLQHRSDPIGCFTVLGSRLASKEIYKDLKEYKKLWLPVVAMEAVKTSVKGLEQIFIHNVDIEWKQHEPSGKTTGSQKIVKMKGQFVLPIEFCKERDINLGTDYVCVRYNNIHIAHDTDLDSEVGSINNNEEGICFVCHCVICDVELIKEKHYVCTLDLHECSMPFPNILLEGVPPTCTVEIIPKSLPDRRIQFAIERLKEDEVSKLAIAIALGTAIAAKEIYTDIDDLLKLKLPGNTLKSLNEVQERVTKSVLRQPFSLIQGPPGTGKTVTGVYIAYYFSERNRSKGGAKRQQVLYCGPSNKSVDVVVEKLLNLGEKCPSIVRVYGNRIENREYPIPRDSIPPKKRSQSEVSNNPAIRNRALHHLIRSRDKPYSMRIERYDQLFKMINEGQLSDDVIQIIYMHIQNYCKRLSKKRAEDILDRDIQEICTQLTVSRLYRDHNISAAVKIISNLVFEHGNQRGDSLELCIDGYKKVLRDAKLSEFGNHDIIISTCMVTGTVAFKQCTNVKQIIIDESAMCTEPETMIPLGCFTEVRNVVLIGDHKQLKPILTEDRAKRLGLQISLFERYSHRASMLEYQYRMHEGIMAFPSEMFYNGKLKCGKEELSQPAELNIWPGGRKHPCVLCHTEGEEETLEVSTDEGSEQSKSNITEVNYVVRVSAYLVRQCRIKYKDIAILSQYRAQCAVIKKMLSTEPGLRDIHVSTVVASQGSEWKYVIFSTVRSLPEIMIEKYPSKSWIRKNLGFIADSNQMNVAITRAKQGLIIIGNRHLLSCDSIWRKLTEHYEKRGLIVNPEDCVMFR